MDEGTLAAGAYFGGIAFVLAAIWGVCRWSHNRHIARYGRPPPGSGLKTFALFVAWCIVLSGLLSFRDWGPLAVIVGGIAVPHLGFDNRAWGPWQRFRDAGIYASVIFVPAALLMLAARA